MVGFLLSVTFACGLVVAVAHVVNTQFLAPVYDVVANLVAFASAVAASTLLHHWIPALLAALAVGCWLTLAWRTTRAIRHRQPLVGHAPLAQRAQAVAAGLQVADQGAHDL